MKLSYFMDWNLKGRAVALLETFIEIQVNWNDNSGGGGGN